MSVETVGANLEHAELLSLAPLEVPRVAGSENGLAVVRVGDLDAGKRCWERADEGGPASLRGAEAVAGCLRRIGLDAPTRDLVDAAERSGFSDLKVRLAASAGLSPADQLQFFRAFGVATQLKVLAHLSPVDAAIQGGQAVLANVNAGVLWRDLLGGEAGAQAYRDFYGHGAANHAIQVIGLAQDPAAADVRGYYINDPELADGAGRYVSRETMQKAAIGPVGRPVGGTIVATDLRAPAGK